jgi:type II secretory pathway pseudopilin PulG
MKKQKNRKSIVRDCRGFSLLEVLLGISVFMIGMLGVTALNISSLKSNTFSGNLSEATLIAAAKIEELMTMDFDDPASQLFDVDNDGNCQALASPPCSSPALNQDQNNDGIDDDNPENTGGQSFRDGKEDFGLDDIEGDADYSDPPQGKNLIYTVYWNVAENEPVTVPQQKTKTIRVIVAWSVKGEQRSISMDTIRMKED